MRFIETPSILILPLETCFTGSALSLSFSVRLDYIYFPTQRALGWNIPLNHGLLNFFNFFYLRYLFTLEMQYRLVLPEHLRFWIKVCSLQVHIPFTITIVWILFFICFCGIHSQLQNVIQFKKLQNKFTFKMLCFFDYIIFLIFICVP